MKIAAELRFKNGSLWEVVKKVGSAKALAAAIGISQQTVGNWLNLYGCPRPGIYKGGYTKEAEQRLEELAGVPIAELFPDGLHDLCKQMLPEDRRRVSMQEIPKERLIELTTKRAGRLHYEEKHDDRIEQQDMAELIRKATKTLSDREREIIDLRYGLKDGHTYTLEEVGHIFKVSKDRIRQIEAKALRKLQQPERSQIIVGCIEDSTCGGTSESLQSRDRQVERNKTASIRSILGIAKSP